MRPVLLVVAFAVLAAAAPPSRGGDGPGRSAVRVDRLSAEPVSGTRIVALDSRRVAVDAGGTTAEVPLADVVEIATSVAPDPERPRGALEVAADLWTGETLFGEIRGGDGDRIELDTPLLGRLRVSIENLASVRFLQRLAQAAEPPDLRPRKDADVVHMVGGDQFAGTIEAFGEKSLRSRTTQKDAVDVPFERLVAVSLLSDGTRGTAPAEGSLRIALRDGTRLLGRDPSLADGRLRIRSPSGFDADCLLADVVAIQSAGSRFAFLSDLPAEVKVTPLWEVAAGDPAVLFAPQMDRSFSGRPLRCGGRTWLDGIGVFSGTTLTWDLGGRYAEFRATAGLDDGAGPLGGVVFRVEVDGKAVWESGFVRPAGAGSRGTPSPVDTPRIPLAGAKKLSLVVLAGDAEDPYPVQDEADWLGAIVVRAEK